MAENPKQKSKKKYSNKTKRVMTALYCKQKDEKSVGFAKICFH